ncbi:unnamed protein product, partial [marine sediment metagenome]
LEPSGIIKGVTPDDVVDYIKVRDLTKPSRLKRVMDVAVSLEVAEHIDEKYADIYVKNITKNSDNLVFSAATPKQGGVGHINEQPHEYWIEKIVACGFVVDEKRTKLFRKHLILTNANKWYCNNIIVFRKQ